MKGDVLKFVFMKLQHGATSLALQLGAVHWEGEALLQTTADQKTATQHMPAVVHLRAPHCRQQKGLGAAEPIPCKMQANTRMGRRKHFTLWLFRVQQSPSETTKQNSWEVTWLQRINTYWGEKIMGTEGLFNLTLGSIMRTSGWNLEPDKFKLETWPTFLIVNVINHWNKVPTK